MVFLNCNNSSTDSESLPVAGLVTCGVDGSVKVWHCLIQPQGREKQQAQKKHTTKASLMMGILDNAQWSCAYSFTYRACRTGGLSVSLDDSVLAVGHGSLLTLWDPNSVELRGKVSLSCVTVTSTATERRSAYLADHGEEGEGQEKMDSFDVNSNNNIVFTSIIEPKNASSQGSGNGEAYLVAATSVAVFVVDLLSLTVLWRLGGDVDGVFVHSISACASEAQVMRRCVNKEGEENTDTCNEGWFAVCMTANHSDGGDDETVTGGSESDISIFSPCSKEALFTSRIPTIATSTTFWTTSTDNTDPTRTAKNVLLAATQSGEMLLLSTPEEDTSNQAPLVLSNGNGYATKMTGRRDMPRLAELELDPQSAIPPSATDLTLLSTSEKAKSFLNSSSSFFSETSSKMPSVSVLFDGYMRNALSKKRKLNEVSSVDTTGKRRAEEDTKSTNSSHNNSHNKATNKFKKNKNNNFADPAFRKKVHSQLFAAFSKSKHSTPVGKNKGKAKGKEGVSGGTKPVTKVSKINNTKSENNNVPTTTAVSEKTPIKKQKTVNDSSTSATPATATATATANATPKQQKSSKVTVKSTKKKANVPVTTSTSDSDGVKKMRSPKARAAKKV